MRRGLYRREVRASQKGLCSRGLRLLGIVLHLESWSPPSVVVHFLLVTTRTQVHRMAEECCCQLSRGASWKPTSTLPAHGRLHLFCIAATCAEGLIKFMNRRREALAVGEGEGVLHHHGCHPGAVSGSPIPIDSRPRASALNHTPQQSLKFR